MGRLSENSVVVLKNKSHAVTADIAVPDAGAEGVIISQGGAFGGWPCTRTTANRPIATTCSAFNSSRSTARRQIPAGDHQVRMEFEYDGGGLGKGGDVTLFLDGEKVGEGRVDNTVPMAFSADETTDVGYDSGTPVTDDLGSKGDQIQRTGALGPARPRQRR